MAATCLWKGEPCIVHCYDTAGTRGAVQSEDIDKRRWIGDNTVLLAGSMSDARQFLALSKAAIEAHKENGDDLSINRMMVGIREAARLRKREIATEILGGRIGMTYQEVFDWSRAHPDDPNYAEAWQVIKSINLGAEFVISTFTDGEVGIISVDHHGKVTWDEHYSAIGTGSPVAAAFLHQRDYFDTMGVEECLFRMLEAKTAAEKNAYVGKATHVELRIPGKPPFYVSPEYTDAIVNFIDKARWTFPDLPFDREKHAIQSVGSYLPVLPQKDELPSDQ